MERREFLATTALASSLGLAGCLSRLDASGTSPAGSATGPEAETTEDDPRNPPNLTMEVQTVEATWRKVVHMEGEAVEDGATRSVAVLVDGERVPVVGEDHSTSSLTVDADVDAGASHEYWAADDDVLAEGETAATEYPISLGNYVYVEAEARQTVSVRWDGDFAPAETLVEETVE
ncbi:hypothetical protein [Haloarchaeobius sp. HRN-SO-5]|uniref:hypothetical protein n=1 Tax=Haloarchaeobius sp. HRN-SO-5 TaxID=3446118 RepID=UPI003EBEF347